MLRGSLLGVAMMVVIVVAGSLWVWIAGTQMSTDYDLAAQAARVAPKAPLSELPAPPRQLPPLPLLPLLPPLSQSSPPVADRRAEPSATRAPPPAVAASSLLAAAKQATRAVAQSPVATMAPEVSLVPPAPPREYYVPPALPAADEDDPAASRELRAWLSARKLAFLTASLEQLGAYRTSDLALLDDRDKR